MTRQEVITHIMHTPSNTNPNVLDGMLKELEKNGDIELTEKTITIEAPGTTIENAPQDQGFSKVTVRAMAPIDYVPTFIPQFDPDEMDILITNLDSFPKDTGGDFYPYVIFSPAQTAYNMEFNFDNATKIRAFIARFDGLSGNYIAPIYYEHASAPEDGLITINMTTGQIMITQGD